MTRAVLLDTGQGAYKVRKPTRMRNHGVSSRSSKPGAKNAFGVACGEESKRTSSDPIQFIGPLTRDLARKLGGGVMELLLVTGSSDVRNRPSVVDRCPSPLLGEGHHSHLLWWPERRPKDAVVTFLGLSCRVVSAVCVHSMRAPARGKRSSGAYPYARTRESLLDDPRLSFCGVCQEPTFSSSEIVSIATPLRVLRRPRFSCSSSDAFSRFNLCRSVVGGDIWLVAPVGGGERWRGRTSIAARTVCARMGRAKRPRTSADRGPKRADIRCYP